MHHFRVALYDMKSGTAGEATKIARSGMIPLFKSMPGYVRYEVGEIDNGGILSFSVWETEREAADAVAAAAGWVAANLADRISLRESHVGNMFWEE